MAARVTTAGDSRRIATILRIRRSLGGDPLKAHRRFALALWIFIGGSFLAGGFLGAALALFAVGWP